MDTTTTEALIVETPRGPSLAGTRITVYSVMDLIKAGRSKHYIAHMMRLTPEQVDAVFAYVEQHKGEVERDYERILHRSEELRAHYEQIFRARSPYPPDMPWEEKRRLLLKKLEAKKRLTQAKNGNHDLA